MSESVSMDLINQAIIKSQMEEEAKKEEKVLDQLVKTTLPQKRPRIDYISKLVKKQLKKERLKQSKQPTNHIQDAINYAKTHATSTVKGLYNQSQNLYEKYAPDNIKNLSIPKSREEAEKMLREILQTKDTDAGPTTILASLGSKITNKLYSLLTNKYTFGIITTILIGASGGSGLIPSILSGLSSIPGAMLGSLSTVISGAGSLLLSGLSTITGGVASLGMNVAEGGINLSRDTVGRFALGTGYDVMTGYEKSFGEGIAGLINPKETQGEASGPRWLLKRGLQLAATDGGDAVLDALLNPYKPKPTESERDARANSWF